MKSSVATGPGATVSRAARFAQHGATADVDDAAKLSGTHGRQHPLGQYQRRDHVERDHVVHLVERHILDLGDFDHPGVVHQMQDLRFCRPVRDRLARARGVTQVNRLERFARHQLIRGPPAEIQHLVAIGNRPLADAATNTAAGTCYQYCCAFHSALIPLSLTSFPHLARSSCSNAPRSGPNRFPGLAASLT